MCLLFSWDDFTRFKRVRFALIWDTKLSFRLDYLYCWELFFIFSEEVAIFTNFIFIQEIGDKGSTHRYRYTMPSSCLWWFSISIDSTKSYSEKQYALIGTNYLRDYDCPFQRSYKFLKISMSSRKISVVIHDCSQAVTYISEEPAEKNFLGIFLLYLTKFFS